MDKTWIGKRCAIVAEGLDKSTKLFYTALILDIDDNNLITFKKWYSNPKNREKQNKTVLRYYYQNHKNSLIRINDYKHKEEIFKVLGGKCTVCGSKRKIQIHHINYIKSDFTKVGLNKRLKLLCFKCHREEHRKYKVLPLQSV